MKTLKSILYISFLVSVSIVFSSCLVGLHHNNGYHRGFYKNNRHHTKKVYIVKPGQPHPGRLKTIGEVRKENNKKNKWNSKK